MLPDRPRHSRSLLKLPKRSVSGVRRVGQAVQGAKGFEYLQAAMCNLRSFSKAESAAFNCLSGDCLRRELPRSRKKMPPTPFCAIQASPALGSYPGAPPPTPAKLHHFYFKLFKFFVFSRSRHVVPAACLLVHHPDAHRHELGLGGQTTRFGSQFDTDGFAGVEEEGQEDQLSRLIIAHNNHKSIDDIKFLSRTFQQVVA